MLLASRISLGPVIPADFGSLFCWANDLDAIRNDAAYRPVDFVQHTQWCEGIGRDPSLVLFAIRRLNDPAIIGYVRISDINAVHRNATFGIRIGTETNRCQGFGKEATALALSFCWNHLNLERVQLIVFGRNERARRAYVAAGFEQEGVLRRGAFVSGEWIDLIVMSALRPVAGGYGHQTDTQVASPPLSPVMPLVVAA